MLVEPPYREDERGGKGDLESAEKFGAEMDDGDREGEGVEPEGAQGEDFERWELAGEGERESDENGGCDGGEKSYEGEGIDEEVLEFFFRAEADDEEGGEEERG